MSFSDSDMFLFEIVVEGLKNYTKKEFHISLKYSDVFTLDLKDPNKIQNKPKKFKKKKVGVRNVQRSEKEDAALVKQASEKCLGKLQSGQTILLARDIPGLVSSMLHFPMELSLWDDESMREKLGSTQIPWSPVYLEYLHKVNRWRNPAPAVVSGGYDVYEDYTSKRLATIRLNIKLTHLADNTCKVQSSPVDRNSNTASCTSINNQSFRQLYDTNAGKIKTSYGTGKLTPRPGSPIKRNTKEVTEESVNIDIIKEYKPRKEPDDKNKHIDLIIGENINSCKISNSRSANSIRSNTDLTKNQQITPVNRIKSCLSLKEAQYNILNYIFGDTQGPLHNKTYCVGYFTVENDPLTSNNVVCAQSTNRSKYNVAVCDESTCPSPKDADGACIERICCDDLLTKAAEHINITKCRDVRCPDAKHPALPDPPNDKILLDITNLKKECCKIQTIEEITGGVNAQMKISEDKCFCECSCSFGFVKRTTYCGICGGYEKPGEDFPEKPPRDAPFPCPIYHKYKKAKAPVEVKKKKPGCDKDNFKKDDRFKFNYGYTAPQIGHSQCAMPCTGTMGSVPKKMGWLWTADNVPGLRFRPAWKPGAVNKQVLHLLRLAKNPDIASNKKRKKETQKKPSKRPLLVVHKKNGEFTITMETMKNFPKQRYLNQQPFEEKPPITYTIGRTDEENAERQKKKERAKRRLERDQREFIQSAFRDMCNEICVKTYQQALGILPNAEDPDCKCFPAEPGPKDANMDRSCSCSEDSRSLASDTDDDEWLVEFTPPSALFDPKFRGKKIVKSDNATQYTYLDYKVKLVDYFGNPVPRFFKTPDGRTHCSDLGGFWGSDGKWLEINTDGFVAPDGKWAPMDFMVGTERVTCESGKFQLANMKWYVVGIDGYIDSHGVWKAYPKPRDSTSSPKLEGEKKQNRDKKHSGDKHQSGDKQQPRDKKQPKNKKQPGRKKDTKKKEYQSDGSFSCFGDVTPHTLSRLGIVGHGHDKQILLSTLQEMIAQGADIKIPERSTVPVQKLKEGRKRPRPLSWKAIDEILLEKTKCHHSVPSEKGVVAMDEDGNKTYFRMKKYKSNMPKERRKILAHHGISLSSFHAPCFSSFINTQMRMQMYGNAKYNKKLIQDVDNQSGW